ncbi:MAG: FtsW/RodA/SpoVE family cell cycle protein, partial [bacterium]
RATRLINLGVVSFQPVEVFKLTVILGYAGLLAGADARASWPLPLWGRVAGLAVASVGFPILQRDFGSAVLMLTMGGAMIWLAGARARDLAGFGAAAGCLAGAALVSAPYRMHRVQQYFAAWGGHGGGGYQTQQSLIALGAGGFFGVGLGESTQKLYYLPSAHADFIFAIIGEELGFLGAFATLGLHVLLLREGLAIAREAGGRFARLFAAGLALLVCSQALWHIAVALVLVPTKGLALPFVSYGGSSLMASMLAVGLILRCAGEPQPRPAAALAVGGRAWAGS